MTIESIYELNYAIHKFLNDFNLVHRIYLTSGTLYFVDVTTGSESKSGTPSRVFFKLIGENGAYGEVELGEEFSKGRLVENSSKLQKDIVGRRKSFQSFIFGCFEKCSP